MEVNTVATAKMKEGASWNILQRLTKCSRVRGRNRSRRKRNEEGTEEREMKCVDFAPFIELSAWGYVHGGFSQLENVSIINSLSLRVCSRWIHDGFN